MSGPQSLFTVFMQEFGFLELWKKQSLVDDLA